MVDLSNNAIKELFEKQVRELTQRTLMAKEDSFDYQFSERWLR